MFIRFRENNGTRSLCSRWLVRLVAGGLLLWLAPMSTYGQTVTATVAAGVNPTAVAVNPLTNKIYVANSGSSNVTVIDGTTNATATVPVGATPSAVAVNPVTNRIYVANRNSSNVTVVDGATNTTVTVTVGSVPDAIAVNPVTDQIYVANSHAANVTVIDGATNLTATVPTDIAPNAIAVNPTTNKIYVANFNAGLVNGGTVTVTDGSTHSTSTVAVGSGPDAIVVNPVTNKIYVANSNSGTVTVIDGATNTTATVAVGMLPVAIAVNPISNKIYVVNDQSGTVTVIDGATNITTTVTVGSFPDAIAVDPVSNKIYVSNSDDGSITVIDGVRNTTITLGAGTKPAAVALNPVTGHIYVADFDSSDVTVISEPQVQPIPLTTSITPFPNDNFPSPGTVPLNFTTNSAYQPIAPPVQNVYFRLNSGGWQRAKGTASNFTANVQLSTGIYKLDAFAADSQFADSIQIGSPIPGALAGYSFTVGNPTTTSLALMAGTNPSPDLVAVTFEAIVDSPAGGTPTGQVTFSDNGSTLGTVTLNGGGFATFSSPFAAGVHTITASYGGDSNFIRSTSAPFSEVVFNSLPVNTSTTTAIARALLPDHVRPSSLFVVQIFSSGTGLPQTGNVVLLDESQQLGPLLPISNQKTQYTTPLTIGMHNIIAVYLGGSSSTGETLNGSVSGPLTLEISPRPKPR